MSTDNLTGTLKSTGHLTGVFTAGGGGTSDYNDLENKPQINGNTLEGNKTTEELGINLPDMSNYYNKSETDTLLNDKANVSALTNYYNKSETDTLLANKADIHHYSTNEQIVDTWIDGSTIYEKTFDLKSDVYISYNAWTETSISWQTLNIDRLAGAEGFTSSGGTFAGVLLASKKSNGSIEIQTPRNGVATGVRYLTLRYTKTST